MHVSALYLYPVKSLRGCSVAAADVDDLGLVPDRRFLVVDPTGKFLTQRTLARMALIATAVSADTLTLSANGTGRIEVPLHSPGGSAQIRTVSVWKSEGLLADDCGDPVARWLTDFLDTPCRLVRIGEKFQRPMLKAVARAGDKVAFTDAFPFMVISEASLNDLNDRLIVAGEATVPMDRFRPSFVLAGCPAFDEDNWKRVRIGNLVLRAGGKCVRCIVTTTDQETAQRGRQPLQLLSTYRRDATDPTAVCFGQNYIHETKRGTVRIGESVEVLA